MIVLAYFIALLIFIICNAIIGGAVRAIWTLFLGYVFKIHNAPYLKSTQFIGELISTMISYSISLYSFIWLNKEYNHLIITIIYVIVSYILLLSAQSKFHPKTQLLGIIIGIILFVIIYK